MWRANQMILLIEYMGCSGIPVISKIFLDLKILDTRFARIVRKFRVIQDIPRG